MDLTKSDGDMLSFYFLKILVSELVCLGHVKRSSSTLVAV